MKNDHVPSIHPATVLYGSEEIDGVHIAYREAGDPTSPKLLLLHGFPSSSHQYRNLIPALASRFHILAPDYPGFGNSDAPDPAAFAYTFDHLAELTSKFIDVKGFKTFGLYMQDYGGPIGLRLVTERPERLEWLVIQNTNAYEVGFTDAWGGLRNALWMHRTAEAEAGVAGLLERNTVKAVYLHGSTQPEMISPDNWEMDFGRTITREHGRTIQLDLFYDYRTNVELYPAWQKFLRDRQPPTQIFWGQDDIFFTREGGEAYLTDLPRAEMHRLAAGHFAVEDCLEYIAEHMKTFHEGLASANPS